MIVAIEDRAPKNPANLGEWAITHAESLENGLIAIHWPPYANTFLSVQPDGSWEPRAGVSGAYEKFRPIPQGFNVNPQWPEGRSIVIAGAVLEQ